ncbi:hypothetical protein I9W82_001480 [Candida metapsilosis]|uniref:F-box domain-containing protein n=1 Tax=Candida metapsilosis TaxID=273372 RepID=A0A8H7ZL82_9ASCO|nr:hypothetical protein I9W82_001480 [Candida metapsilosis]
MLSLTCLPHEILEQVFHQLNQHEALTFAPLHSKFYYVAKSKLYRNLYVYAPWPLQTDSTKQGEIQSNFHFPKNLDNCKSKSYTIISNDTFERYLAKLDKTQEIFRLELYCHNMTIIDCIFKHFKKIRYFQLLSIYINHPEGCSDVFSDNYSDFVEEYVRLYQPGTIYISPKNRCFDTLSDFVSFNSIMLSSTYCRDNPECVSQMTNLTELTIWVNNVLRDQPWKFHMKLRVLRIYSVSKLSHMTSSLCDRFDTSCLRELYAGGHLDVNKLFTNSDLQIDYPKLVQLSLEFDSIYYGPYFLRVFKRFKHRTLRSLVISSPSPCESDARIVCDLCPQYPSSSINWWAKLWRNSHDYFVMFDVSLLSPNLPFGVVGCHSPNWNAEKLAKFKHRVVYGTEDVEITLRRCYTRAELETIYDSESRRRYHTIKV